MNTQNRKAMTAQEYAERLDEIKHMAPDATLLYEDPIITNPEELATYPKPAAKVAQDELAEESEIRLVSVQHSHVRDGRTITRTDTAPDVNGYM